MALCLPDGRQTRCVAACGRLNPIDNLPHVHTARRVAPRGACLACTNLVLCICRVILRPCRSGITSQLDEVVYNGDREGGYPGCVNLSFAYVEGESLLMALKDIALSSGSACTSASLEPSYVLRAIGASEDLAHSSIRFGIGRFTTEEEVDFVVNKVVEKTTWLREMSPLWEMKQEGIDYTKIEWSQH